VKEKDIEVRSCNGKAMSITYCGGMFVALGTQHAKRMRHIVIRGLSGSTVFFFHIISQRWVLAPTAVERTQAGTRTIHTHTHTHK
jgi:hypothetical protein